MADNVELDAGSGGATLATDDIGGTHYQIGKVAFGALDSATLAASGAGNVSAGVQRVTLAADDPAVVDLAAIEVLLTTIAGDTTAIEAAVEGTLTVGSHAVTNAGTFAVQEDGAALTALQLVDDIVYVDDADWVDGTSKHALVGGLYQSSPQTVTDGDVAPFNITANGALHVAQQGVVTVDLGANNDVTVTGTVTANLGATDTAALAAIETATEAAQAALETAGGLLVNLGANNDVTVTGTVTANLSATDNQVLDNIDGDLTTIIGHVDGIETLIGTTNTTLGTIDTDTGNIATSVATIAAAVSTEMQVDVVAALPAGDNNIGNVDIASALPAGTNNIGDVDVLSIAAGTNSIGNVGLIGRTSGGMSIFRSLDIDETEEEIKATAGQVFSITAFNTTAAPLYLKFYNATAANVTVGTTTPVLTFLVPANADSDGAGFVWNNTIGFAFGTAITVACTTAIADNDTGAPGANACLVNVGFA